jgi:hypothetical protein
MVRAALTLLTLACTLLVAGCGGTDVTTTTTDAAVPTEAIQSANTIKAKANMKQVEFALLACHAERETFEGCQLPGADDIIVNTATATTFEIATGDLLSRYDATTDTVPCHSTISKAAGCVEW